MNKPYNFKNNIELLQQFKLNAIISLEAKKKALLSSEMLEKIKKYLNKNEYEKFLSLSKKVSYGELQEIFNSIYRARCVQKVCLI